MAGSTEVDLDELMARLTALAAAQAPSGEVGSEDGAGGNFDCVGCEGCRRCRFCAACSDCEDCTYCEECVECVSCTHAVRSVECGDSSHLRDCRGCEDSRYLLLCVECVSCTYCLGCVGLEGEEFHVLNESVTRSQYFKLVKALSIEMEVRTHLGWRPGVIGLEPAERDPAWDDGAQADEGDGELRAATDPIDEIPEDTSRLAVQAGGGLAGSGSQRGRGVAHDSRSAAATHRGEEDERRSFTGFEDPPTPSTSSAVGRSGWISAIADATGGADEDDPITDSSLPEVTHTRLIEPTDPRASIASSESKGPEHLSLDALDAEGAGDEASKRPPSLSSQRLGEAVSRSVRGRGERRRSGDGEGLDPLGALGEGGAPRSTLSKLRAGARGPSTTTDHRAEPSSEEEPPRSLFDPVSAPSAPRKGEANENSDASRASLRRGRRPVRRGRAPSDDDDPAKD